MSTDAKRVTTRSYSAQVFDAERRKWKELSRFENEVDAAGYSFAMRCRWPACFTDSRAEPSEHYYNTRIGPDDGLLFVDMRRQFMGEIKRGVAEAERTGKPG